MKIFFDFLIEEYGNTAMELSKSDGGNILVKTQISMIDLDSLSKKLNVINQDFKERFVTADALHFIIKNKLNLKIKILLFKNNV